MKRFGWFGLLMVLLLAVVAGGIGYSLGMSNAAAAAVSAGDATVTYVVGTGWGPGLGGFPFFGLLFGFLVFALVIGIFRRAAWAGRGGWYGPGRWSEAGPSHYHRDCPDDGKTADGPRPATPGSDSGARPPAGPAAQG